MELNIRNTKPAYERLVDNRIAVLELLRVMCFALQQSNELFNLDTAQRADLDAILAILDTRGDL